VVDVAAAVVNEADAREGRWNPSSARLGVGRKAPELDQLETHRLDLRQDPVEGSLVWNKAAEHGVLTVDPRTQVGKGAEHAWPQMASNPDRVIHSPSV
jgi:hypothetical protein